MYIDLFETELKPEMSGWTQAAMQQNTNIYVHTVFPHIVSTATILL